MHTEQRSTRPSADDDGGAIAAEYVAILLVLAGLVAAVLGLGLDDRISEEGNDAVDRLFQQSMAQTVA